MLTTIKPLHLLLCIFAVWPSLVLTLSAPSQRRQNALSKRSPTNPPQCHTYAIPTDIAVKLNCRKLIEEQVLDGPGPFHSSTAWKETRDPANNSIWTVSDKSCGIGFQAPPQLSPSSWEEYKQGIQAIARTCVDEQGFGGTVSGALPGQPNTAIIWVTQVLTESRFKRSCLSLLFSRPSSLSTGQKKMRKGCYQMIGATAFVTAAPVVMLESPALGLFLFAGGGFLAAQGRRNRQAGLAERGWRRRSVGGEMGTVLKEKERALVSRQKRLRARTAGRLTPEDRVRATRGYAGFETGVRADKMLRLRRTV